MAKQISVQDFIFEAVTNKQMPELKKLFGKFDKAGQMEYLRKRNQLGETALAVAIKLKHYEMIEWLVKLIKDCVNRRLCRSLCLPTFCQIRINQISVVEMMDYLLDPWLLEPRQDELSWLEFLFYSVRISSVTQKEKAHLFELIGSAFIFYQASKKSRKIGNIYIYDRGIECWKSAIGVRKSRLGRPTIPKIPYELSDTARKAFGVNSTEWSGLEEMEQFEREAFSISDSGLPVWKIESSDWYFQLQVQALLVTQRIACQVNSGRAASPNYFYLNHLIRLGWECNKRKQFDQAISICFLVFEQSAGLNPTTVSPKCTNIFIETFDLLANCFKDIKESTGTISEELSVANILSALKYCIAIAHLLPVSSAENEDRNRRKVKLFSVYDFVLFLTDLQLSKMEHQQLEENLSLYVRHAVHRGSCQLLHAAVNQAIWYHEIVSQDVMQLLFSVGVNPNATNKKGKTPLHVLAESWNWTRLSSSDWDQFPEREFSILFRSIVNAGGHLDQATPGGQTVLSILKEIRAKHSLLAIPFDPYLDSLVNVVLSLSCYCATAIRRNGIPYEDELQLPRRLHSFVRRHSALKG